ncbi:unnamed protein product [Sphenostylis stenocarpa]|uniref:Uncharacterized protein n=1 Tax=Sphenostylis stenocarpa TaxID=92480 RepID=A0AA86RXS7_9FABA|nr:unnamed protein product [Sphenostylis stenocarpa]
MHGVRETQKIDQKTDMHREIEMRMILVTPYKEDNFPESREVALYLLNVFVSVSH